MVFKGLNDHKFRHNFNDCVSPMCGCGLEIESTQHFFLRCCFCHVERSELFNSLYDIDLAKNELNENSVTNLVYLAQITIIKRQIENRKILLKCITYLKATKIFGNRYDHRQ